MTDLSKGIFEIEGIRIGPDTTPEEFEKNSGNLFSKEVLHPTLVLYALNGNVLRLPNNDFVQGKHRQVVINGMTFYNVVVLFRDGHIEKIELISNLTNWDIDAEGKKRYSPQKEEACFNKMVCWGTEAIGASPYGGFCWNYEWGCLKCSTGSASRVFFVEYGRNYKL